MSNVEGMYSVYFYKKTERSETILRNSAVRCLARLAAAEAARMVEKKL